MIGKLDETLAFQANALKLRGYRQQLLASNLANADTPNYKAVDFNFAESMKAAAGAQSGKSAPAPLQITAPAHLRGIASAPAEVRVQYRGALQASIDGNSVDLDTERAHFADNAVRYEAAVRFLNGQIRDLTTAMKGE
ncbi:MAG: flagellar basal body rod protein FlgB [Betaproteobacteria bacterium]|nr:flagellar basal body rod protein FlgB [Betaproteobacteria bacterium]